MERRIIHATIFLLRKGMNSNFVLIITGMRNKLDRKNWHGSQASDLHRTHAICIDCDTRIASLRAGWWSI